MSLPQVPGFTVTRRIGAGSTGTVWSATRDADGAPVAIKLVTGPADDRGDPGTPRVPGDAVEQAAREAAILAALDHPHVVRLHAATALPGGTLALVLDLVDGGSYASVVSARGAPAPGEVVTSLSPVSRAVAHLHALGVVHADLSPGNVLFTGEGRPMVSDLGVARLFGERPETLHGTEGFTAPEVLMGAPPTPASDVYAIGALAWLGLTGAAPELPAERPALESVVRDQPVRLVQLVERCLSADPGARPTAASLAVDLYDAAVAEPVQLGDRSDPAASITHRIRASARSEAPPEPPPRRRRLPLRRHARGSSRRPGAVPLRSAAHGDPPSARAAAVPGRAAATASRRGLAPRGRRRRAASRNGLRSAGAGVLLVLLLAVVLGGGAGVWVHGSAGRGRPLGWTPGRTDTARRAPIGGHAEPCCGRQRCRRAGARDGGAALRRCGRPATHVRAECGPHRRPCSSASPTPGPGPTGARRQLLGAVDVSRLTGTGPAPAGDPGCVAAGATYAGAALRRALGQTTSADGDLATVRAQVDTSAHTVVGRDGDRTPGQRRWAAGAIALRWTAGGWRIQQ